MAENENSKVTSLAINYDYALKINTTPKAEQPTWAVVSDGFDNIGKSLNEVLYQGSYLGDGGWGSSEVTGGQLTVTISGVRKHGDAAQDYIFSDAVKNNWGDARKTTFEITYVVNAAISLINRIIDKINKLTGAIGIEIDNIDNVDFTPDGSDMGGSGGGGHRDGSPGYAFGKDYIPEDDFPAKLHRGEAVLSAADAEAFRKLGGKGSLEKLASAPADSGASGQLSEVLGKLAENSGTTNNITQNNYSPKELSPYETKRYLDQVAQQLSERK